MNTSAQVPIWKQILRKNFLDLDQLACFLQLSSAQVKKLFARPRFILNLPLRLAEKIEKGNLQDPIFRQFVPLSEEGISANGFLTDPVGDILCRSEKKLLRKYQGRVLLVTTGACAMHCRYCFRQNFDYEVVKGFESELKNIADDPSINEVILSGGDPLSLDDSTLGDLLKKLANIPHVRKIRFHTRFPVGIPERINESFLNLLKSIRLQFWFIVHVNHPRELDESVLLALKSVQMLGIPVLNQSVLLKGVNDHPDVLIELSSRLVDHGIIPYYLHQLDRVSGSAHFEVSKQKGKRLMKILTEKLPGYAVPKYVCEISGMPSKTAIV